MHSGWLCFNIDMNRRSEKVKDQSLKIDRQNQMEFIEILLVCVCVLISFSFSVLKRSIQTAIEWQIKIA